MQPWLEAILFTAAQVAVATEFCEAAATCCFLFGKRFEVPLKENFGMQPPAFQQSRCGTAHAGAVVEFCEVAAVRARPAAMVEPMRSPLAFRGLYLRGFGRRTWAQDAEQVGQRANRIGLGSMEGGRGLVVPRFDDRRCALAVDQPPNARTPRVGYQSPQRNGGRVHAQSIPRRVAPA